MNSVLTHWKSKSYGSIVESIPKLDDLEAREIASIYAENKGVSKVEIIAYQGNKIHTTIIKGDKNG